MKYFKILIDNVIIGAVSSNQFMRYLPITDCFVRATEQNGEYIAYNNKFYRATWMCPIVQATDYIEAQIIDIEKEEYELYIKAIEKNEEIQYEEAQEDQDFNEEIIYEIDSVKQSSLDFIRSSKLNEMSYQCKKTIENGFDLELRGATHHYSLTTQDQLNLMSLGTMAQTSNEIPYHADGEEVIFYTSEEINQIIAAANTFKTYQTTYYNSLKAYINSLETIEEISAIEYGIEIPEKFKTEVLKALEHK